jgi:hypothetical protein
LEVLDMAARGIVKTHLKVRKLEELTDVFHEMSEGKSKTPRKPTCSLSRTVSRVIGHISLTE